MSKRGAPYYRQFGTSGDGQQAQGGPTGAQGIAQKDNRIFARLIGLAGVTSSSDQVAYYWVQSQPAAEGAWADDDYGLACTAVASQQQTGYAWELNGKDDIPADSIVEIEYLNGVIDDRGESWRILLSAGGKAFVGFDVADDKGHSYADRDKITIENSTVTDDGSGDSTFVIDDASDTLKGKINLVEQIVGQGLKKFQRVLSNYDRAATGIGSNSPFAVYAADDAFAGSHSLILTYSTSTDEQIILFDGKNPTDGITSIVNCYGKITNQDWVRTENGGVGASSQFIQWRPGTATTSPTFCDLAPAQIRASEDFGGSLYECSIDFNGVGASPDGGTTPGPQPRIIFGGYQITGTVPILCVMDGVNPLTDSIYEGVTGTILYGGTATSGLVTALGSALDAADISDFDEAAQDATGAILTNTARVTLTYDDATPSIEADLVTDSIDANYLHASAASVLMGRGAGAGSGAGEEITLGGSLAMTGTTLEVDVVDGGTV